MNKILLVGTNIIETIEENLYEIEVPDNLSIEEIELFIFKNKKKLIFKENLKKKKIIEESTHIKNIHDKKKKVSIKIKEKNTIVENIIDNTIVKEALNQYIIKDNFFKFEEYFNKNSHNLKHSDFYILLHNSYNNNLIDFIKFLLLNSKGKIKEEQLARILKDIGIINNKDIVELYMELDYDKLNLGETTLKELFVKKGFNKLIPIFDKNIST